MLPGAKVQRKCVWTDFQLLYNCVDCCSKYDRDKADIRSQFYVSCQIFKECVEICVKSLFTSRLELVFYGWKAHQEMEL